MKAEISHQLPGGSPSRKRVRKAFALGAPRALVAPVEVLLDAARTLAQADRAAAFAVDGRNVTLVAMRGPGEAPQSRLAARALAQGAPILDTTAERYTLAIPMAEPAPEGTERRRYRPRSSVASACLVLEGPGPAPAAAFTTVQQLAVARALLVSLEARAFSDSVATDASTGALSRPAFERAAQSELQLAAGMDRPAALVLVEVGSRAARIEVELAEEALTAVAEALRLALRTEDLVARRGPDELCCLLLDSSPEHLPATLERLARATAAVLEPLRIPAPILAAASFPGHGGGLDELDAAALEALESARTAGPGTFRVHNPGEGHSPTACRRSFFTGDASLDARKANLLFESILAANAARELPEALDALLRALLAATGADRAAVLAGDGQKLEVQAARDHDFQEIDPPFRYSRSACLRALALGRAALVTDTNQPGNGVGPSAYDLQLRSVLAVPLLGRSGPLGVLYADSLRPSARSYGPEELAYLEALAAQAALAIENATLRQRLEEENIALKRAVRRDLGTPLLVGASPAFRQATRYLPEIVESDASVLILGESGTGKDLLARAIHELGPRARGNFVAQNCAAIPSDLLESELFGHAAGAFSGASRAKRGLLELADQGSFFLDEVGELPLALQAKLLRVLEDKEVRRIGETRGKRIDFRLICATNRDLAQDVESGRFRRDLFYRINVFSMNLPPLRERLDDIEDLARFFLGRAASRLGRPQPELSPEALALLKTSSWPGNVRELANVLEKAVTLARGGRIEPAHVGFEIGPDPGNDGQTTLREVLARVEARLLGDALKACDGNVSQAARRLGIARQQLQRLMRRYGLRAGERPSA